MGAQPTHTSSGISWVPGEGAWGAPAARRRWPRVLLFIAGSLVLTAAAAALCGCTSFEAESDNTATGKQTIKAGGVPLPHPLAPRASRRVTRTSAEGQVTECDTCEGPTCEGSK